MNQIYLGKKVLFTLLGLTLLCAFYATAVYVIEDANDPYTDKCVFDVPMGESIFYINDADPNPQGMFGFSFDTNYTIGQYIREKHPEIWDMLSPHDQDLYNTRAALYDIGASVPILPTKVKNLLSTYGRDVQKSGGMANFNIMESPKIAPLEFTQDIIPVQSTTVIPLQPIGLKDATVIGSVYCTEPFDVTSQQLISAHFGLKGNQIVGY
jgi:hypothetical protein